MKKSVSVILVGFLTLKGISQNETTKWYFGNSAGLDFMTNPPTILTNGVMNATEGCASLADINGNLLFYTRGDTIKNKVHQVMANGGGLFGQVSSVQSSLFVKQSGSTTIYYVFTQAGAFTGSGQGLHYSIIDMSLAAGMGSVTVKNIPLYPNICKEALGGVRHCNGADVWVMCHEAYTNNFRAFLVNATGVSATPVISSAGITANFPAGNSLKFSPDGKKLALIDIISAPGTGTCILQLFDFNPSSGVVSNAFSLSAVNNSTGFYYGCEFSPDGSKLYASIPAGAGKIYQWDLCAGSPTAIAASIYTIVGQPGQGNSWQMQRAIDGKIYTSRSGGGSTFLDVINNPNLAGAACNFVGSAQSTAPRTPQSGLPNFISNQFKPRFQFTPGAICASATFTSPALLGSTSTMGCTTNTVTGLFWLFGDPASGAANTSTVDMPVHNYPGPGTYTVKLPITTNSPCAQDTIRLPVVILSQAPLSVITNTLSCTTASASVNVSGGSGNYTYLWSLGSQTNTTVSGLTPGIYTVTVNDLTNLCSVSQTVQVSSLPIPTVSINGNFTICTGEVANITANGANTYTWNNSNSTNSTITFSPSVTKSYTVTGQALNTCTTQNTFTVTVSKCTGLLENTSSNNFVKIYPNPSSGILFVETSEAIHLSIYDPLGKIVVARSFEAGNHSVDIRKFAAGLYFIKTWGEGGTNSFTVVKGE